MGFEAPGQASGAAEVAAKEKARVRAGAEALEEPYTVTDENTGGKKTVTVGSVIAKNKVAGMGERTRLIQMAYDDLTKENGREPTEQEWLGRIAQYGRVISQERAGGSVTGTTEAQRSIPLAMSPSKGQIFVDVTSEQRISTSTKVGDVMDRISRGEVVELEQKQYASLIDFKELDGLFLQLEKVAKAALASSTPGANLINAVKLAVERKLGADTPAVDVNVLQALDLRFGKAMQGAASQLSNIDIKAAGELNIKSTDSLPQALRKIALGRAIVKNARKAILLGAGGKTADQVRESLPGEQSPGKGKILKIERIK